MLSAAAGRVGVAVLRVSRMSSAKRPRGAKGMSGAGTGVEMLHGWGPIGDDFRAMREAMALEDADREQVIKRSRDVQKLSKQAIYSLHRDDVARAEAQLEEARVAIGGIGSYVGSSLLLRGGSFSASLEEYAEALIFKHFLTAYVPGERGDAPVRASPLPLRAEMPSDVALNEAEYVGGVLDCMGELVRWAVKRATQRDAGDVKLARQVCDAVNGELMQFDFRNGPLRKKYDGLKYNERKLETLLYELAITETRGLRPAGGDGGGGDSEGEGEVEGGA